jgi:hypothetical protein
MKRLELEVLGEVLEKNGVRLFDFVNELYYKEQREIEFKEMFEYHETKNGVVCGVLKVCMKLDKNNWYLLDEHDVEIKKTNDFYSLVDKKSETYFTPDIVEFEELQNIEEYIEAMNDDIYNNSLKKKKSQLLELSEEEQTDEVISEIQEVNDEIKELENEYSTNTIKFL